MAKDKKSFVLYSDLIHTVELLTDKQAGELFKHILLYVNDKNPKTESSITKISFEPIKQQLKRDLVKFEQVKKKRSEAGRISAEKRAKQKATNSTSVKSVQHRSTNPTVNDNDNDNDNVIKIDYKALVDYFNSITGKSTRVVNNKTKQQLNARLKEGYTKEDIMKAINTCYNDSYHKDTKHKFLTLEFISRADKLDKFSSMSTKELTLQELIRGKTK